MPPERKVLLVLDQFEQWLHAKRGEENTELVAALRQCDGEHVQAIVMVRDDFWMAASRFMRDLEIRLLEGENIGARRSLRSSPCQEGADGIRPGLRDACPKTSDDLGSDQNAFLDQSIAGLPQDGKIISVRLALFAEMVKGKALDSGHAQGGRRHEGSRRDVPRRDLQRLDRSSRASPAPEGRPGGAESALPESGTDIKGQMRSRQELLEASGYANRPRDFDDLIHILDPELRLITPTDPEGCRRKDEG